MHHATHRIAALLLCSTLGLSATQSTAHHSYAQFDTARCESIVGTVRNVVMTYPHAWLWLTTKDAKGGAEIWGFEGASPVVLRKLGWTQTAVKVGDTVTVRYSPLKDGRHGGSFASVQLAGGRELLGGSPACTEKR